MMPGTLRPLSSAVLPPTGGIRLLAVSVEEASVQRQLTATAPTAACPGCAGPAAARPRRDQRRLIDLPWGLRAVRIPLTVRTFRCRNQACGRRIVTERVPDLVAA
jgi:transposase